jgi:hypothetical protein
MPEIRLSFQIKSQTFLSNPYSIRKFQSMTLCWKLEVQNILSLLTYERELIFSVKWAFSEF